MTDEDWQNNEEVDLEDEIVVMIMAREHMQAALDELGRTISRGIYDGLTKEKIAILERQHQEQSRDLEAFNDTLEQRGIEFLVSPQGWIVKD